MIILFVLMIACFFIGKLIEKNNYNKKNLKVQKKINKKFNKEYNKEKLLKILKNKKFILLFLFLANCSCGNYYIPLVNYNDTEQQEILEFLETNNNKTIDKVIIDYWKLRDIIREIN